MDTEEYYNKFSHWYERERGKGYHALLDDMEVDLARPYVQGKEILEAGCGTGLLLSRLAPLAKRAVGVDISEGMLVKARERGLTVVQGSLTELPFDDETFDLVYSFKVLAHVNPIYRAISELKRVTRPGGHVIMEFYNPWSLRYFVKAFKPPSRVAEETTDEEVYTRYDSLGEIKWMLPTSMEVVKVRGIRTAIPTAHVFRIPVVNRLLTTLEWTLADSFLARYAGFLAVVARRRE